jgi:hypothetical protein
MSKHVPSSRDNARSNVRALWRKYRVQMSAHYGESIAFKCPRIKPSHARPNVRAISRPFRVQMSALLRLLPRRFPLRARHLRFDAPQRVFPKRLERLGAFLECRRLLRRHLHDQPLLMPRARNAFSFGICGKFRMRCFGKLLDCFDHVRFDAFS